MKGDAEGARKERRGKGKEEDGRAFSCCRAGERGEREERKTRDRNERNLFFFFPRRRFLFLVRLFQILKGLCARARALS